VQALENKDANGKRFIVSTEKAPSFQEMAQVLKSNGYNKVSTKVAPNFFLKFMANFNSDLKGMLPYIGNTFNGDVSDTMNTFNWKPIAFKKTFLDTAKSVEAAMQQ
jgi:dihydroflavonol-4-reductase